MMKFQRKPLLNDISLVIPTLGLPILSNAYTGSLWAALARLLDRGGPGLDTDVAEWLGACAAYWNTCQTHSFDAAWTLGRH